MTPSSPICYRSCNFCGAVTFRVFKQIDAPFPNQIYGDAALTFPNVGKHLKLQYLECTRCGLVFVNPLTVFSDINKRTFDGERNIVAWADFDYDFYEKDKRNLIQMLYARYEIDRYRQVNRLLDVSCGPGVSLHWLRDFKGWDVCGVDPDRHSVRLGKKRYGLTIVNGLIDDVRDADEHFDIIMIDNSLEHTFDPLGTLLTSFRLLRKGGALLVAVPNCDGLGTKFLNHNSWWGHWFFYRPRVLCKMLWRIGFQLQGLTAVGLNTEALKRGRKTEPLIQGSDVALRGDNQIKSQVDRTEFCSDYFDLLAAKPEDASSAATDEAELRTIATASLVERETIEVLAKDSGNRQRESARNGESRTDDSPMSSRYAKTS